MQSNAQVLAVGQAIPSTISYNFFLRDYCGWTILLCLAVESFQPSTSTNMLQFSRLDQILDQFALCNHLSPNQCWSSIPHPSCIYYLCTSNPCYFFGMIQVCAAEYLLVWRWLLAPSCSKVLEPFHLVFCPAWRLVLYTVRHAPF